MLYSLLTLYLVHLVLKPLMFFLTNHVAFAVLTTLKDLKWRHASCHAKVGQDDGLVSYQILK